MSAASYLAGGSHVSRRNEVRTGHRERQDQDLGTVDVDAVRLCLRRPLFSLYRPDFQANLEAAQVGGFSVNQSFLLGTTAYVVIPSLMVFSTLVLQPRLNRIANIALGIVYVVTIVIGAVGEWGYYILGSVVEAAMLAAIIYYAWTWPKQAPPDIQ
jgi:hypothetical protein